MYAFGRGSGADYDPADPAACRHEIQKSFAHGDIGDVRAPYLIRGAYFLFPQEIGIFPVRRMWLCRLGMLVYGHQMHQTHQASDTFPACCIAVQA